MGNVSYAANAKVPVLDPSLGGQMGYGPDYTQMINNAAYMMRDTICVLLAEPTGFAMLPNGDKLTSTLKAMLELHARSFDGLEQGFEVDTIQTPFGRSGLQMEHFTKVRITESSLTFRIPEKAGRPFSRFLRYYMNELMSNPLTGVANIVTRGTIPADQLPDFYTFSCAFIEPDAFHKRVQKAWIVGNMFPKATGPIQGRRTEEGTMEEVVYDIPFSGLVNIGDQVDEFCQGLLDQMNLTNADPLRATPLETAISANVAAASGYASKIAELATQASTV